MEPDRRSEGWDALVEATQPADRADRVAQAFAHCFRDAAGALALQHLRKLFLDRRLGPAASDAELRYVEGQRSVVAHILALIERGRSRTPPLPAKEG